MGGKGGSHARQTGQGSSGQCNQDGTSADAEAEQTNKIERISKSEAVGSSCCLRSPSHRKPNHIKKKKKKKTGQEPYATRRPEMRHARLDSLQASVQDGKRRRDARSSSAPLLLCTHASPCPLAFRLLFPSLILVRQDYFIFPTE